MATLIKANGESKEVLPKSGEYFSLEELQTFVGGYIQIIHLSDNRLMVMNEEGKFDPSLKRNHKAYELASDILFPGDWIAGDVVVCSDSEVD